MALPGFIEYLFYGYEQREKESGFFTPENFENSAAADSRLPPTVKMKSGETPIVPLLWLPLVSSTCQVFATNGEVDFKNKLPV